MSKFSGLSVPVDVAARLTLTNPHNGQPIRNKETGEAAWIDLYSASSKIGRAHDRMMTDKALKRGNRRLTSEEFEADQLEMLAKLTKAWSLVMLDGTPLDVDCTQADARELYSEDGLVWIVEQVRAFVADLGNFRSPASVS